MSKTDVLHMIGNAHLDLVWLWRWQEGFQEVKATFRAVLDLMAQDPDFLFTSSSAAMYDWVERNDPQMFAEIRQRVAEGRWEIAGGWWVQPDCNLPCGESLVRQGLYGQRYFKEKLGVAATVGYNPDSFGHAASLPQILHKSGLFSYVFTRPHPHEKRLPSRLFRWESADGSRVLAYRIPYEYNAPPGDIHLHVERCAAEFTRGLTELMCFYGVGNHGGGPTRENLAGIRAMNADPAYPELRLSMTSRYFCAVRGVEVPAVRDELQHHATGCYSAHSGVKRWNRESENRLLSAESLSALAQRVTGLPYPADFAQAWKDVLFNQFHDILAGTSIEPAYDDARNLYGEAMAIAGRNLNNAVQALSWRVDIPFEEGMRPIVVFNPHAWPVRTEVEVDLARVKDGDVLRDAAGISVPFQKVRPPATLSSGSRNRISFVADLPAWGYQLYRLGPVPSPPTPLPHVGEGSPDRKSRDDPRGSSLGNIPPLPCNGRGGQGGEGSLENDCFRLEINPISGCLRSLYDKRLAFEWLRGEAAQGLVIDDRSDTWGHGVLRYDRVIGSFTARSIRLLEDGPVKTVIRVESEYGRSLLTQDYVLYRDLELIEVHAAVDWHEQYAMLKLGFPLNLFYTTASYEIPYGSIERAATGEEEPGQSWVDLTGIGRNDGRRLGMSILNDGKYSFDMTEHEMRLTVLRSPVYAHHVPCETEADAPYSFIDQGLQRFRYALLPHIGSWQGAGTVRRAAEFNRPPVVQLESCHPGPLPPSDSYICVEPGNVVVAAIKRAEDGEALVLRCLETSGEPCRAAIRLPHWNRQIEADFAPGELKTFLVPDEASEPTRETNLIEW